MKNNPGIRRRSGTVGSGGAAVLAAILLLGTICPASSTCAVGGYSRARYVLPADTLKKGVSFAQVKIPLHRSDVAERVVEQINYLLMDRRAGMLQWFDRMAMYGPLIRKILRDEKVPDDMIYLAALLSGLTPNAKGRSGGVGWWLIGSVKEKKSPRLIQWVATNDWDDRRDPVLSTRIACTIFQWLHGRPATRNWLLTVCAFVDGTDKVDAVIKKSPVFSYWDMVMPTGSETIIARLVALKLIDTHREFYGVNIKTPGPLTYDFLDRLKLRKDLPLYVVARWCGTNPRSLWELNPGVAPSAGVLPRPDKRSPSGFPLRVPKGMGRNVKKLLVKEGYLSG
jgi:membrane-bound lytic murein transglycosylase D